ncbi:hypothetical protein [Agromyces arachidis]|uniref:hypothetical protein n=1 Tax=Agromyces arachidis TaxID=766966 RepID=UPI00405681C1
MTHARAILVIPAVAGALLFSGCTAPSAPGDAGSTAPAATTESDASGDQSVAEACDILAAGAEEFAALSSDDAFAEGMEDPEGVGHKLESASETFSSAVSDVTNPEVKEAAANADEAMRAYVTYVTEAAADPAAADLEGMGPYIEDITESFTAVGELCS